MWRCWTKCFFIPIFLIEWLAWTLNWTNRFSSYCEQYFCTLSLPFRALSFMNGNFDNLGRVWDGKTISKSIKIIDVWSLYRMVFRMSRSNNLSVTELGNSREIADLNRGNIVEELARHSAYYSEVRGRKKQFLRKRGDRSNLRPNCKHWEFVDEKKDFEKVLVPRHSLSAESIPVFRSVKYFSSV